MGMHDTQPQLEPKIGKQPSKFLGKQKPLSQRDAEVERVVPVQTLLSGLPVAQVQHFNRSYISNFDGNIGSASTRAIEDVYTVVTGRSLILTSIIQRWYAFDATAAGEYVEIPSTTNLVGQPAYLNVYANNSSLLEDSSIFENPTLAITPQSISGTLIRGQNILDYGFHRTGLLVKENEAVQIEYLCPKQLGVGILLPDPYPNLIEIELRGFTLPSKVLQDARMLYGI